VTADGTTRAEDSSNADVAARCEVSEPSSDPLLAQELASEPGDAGETST
jgi:hypothetical protein